LIGQVADYEVVATVADDNVLPVLQAQLPPRLGGGQRGATIWVLGPLSRTPWASARARLEPVAAVRSSYLPQWLEAGSAEWSQRAVIWVSATTPVRGSLAAPSDGTGPAERLRALAAAARGAHALHQAGQLHGGICPQAIALLVDAGGGAGDRARAVLAPPPLANGVQPLAQVGYPPIGYVDPQLLRGEGGRWSDIWSLGATARYTLVGSCPYPGTEELPVVRALAQLLEVPAPAPADLPPAVASLVESCLAQDPEARPGTAEEVAERLEQAAGELEVTRGA